MKIGFASTDWSRSVYDDNGHPVWGGSGWARLGQYKTLLPHDVVAGNLCSRRGELGVVDWDGNTHFGLDIILMQRVMMREVAEIVPSAVANGQIIINDVDDWYWGLSTSNQAWKLSHPKFNPVENINFYKTIIAKSSGVIASTDYLAQRMSNWVRSPIHVIGNHVDIKRFTIREHSDYERPIVGWAGSTSHRSGDLELLRGVLPKLVNSGKILVQHSGHVPGARTFAEAVGLPDEAVITLPMVGAERYPELLNFDIGLVPLTDIPFNLAKSFIKGMEYTASGIPFIASGVGEYKRLSSQYDIGRLVKKPGQWIAAIEELCDYSTRKVEADKNISNLQSLDISRGAKLLNEFLESFK